MRQLNISSEICDLFQGSVGPLILAFKVDPEDYYKVYPIGDNKIDNNTHY